jgi:dGTPase
MGQARRIVRDLFDLFLSDPSLLPTELQKKTSDPNSEVTARVVCDYIAGMTDNYAINEHKQLYSTSGYI